MLRKTSSSEENISVANQCVTEQNSLQLQKEVEAKVLTETLKKNEKHCDSYSPIKNEKEKKSSKPNV